MTKTIRRHLFAAGNVRDAGPAGKNAIHAARKSFRCRTGSANCTEAYHADSPRGIPCAIPGPEGSVVHFPPLDRLGAVASTQGSWWHGRRRLTAGREVLLGWTVQTQTLSA